MIGRRISYRDNPSGAAISSAPTVHISPSPFFVVRSYPSSIPKTKMKFASTLLAVVAVSASMAAAAPAAATSAVSAKCNNNNSGWMCSWKKDAVPEPVVVVEERTVGSKCNNNNSGWMCECSSESVDSLRAILRPDCCLSGIIASFRVGSWKRAVGLA